MAFTLRYMGKRAYKYVTKTMKIPLPSLRKLHRWASKLDFQSGTLHCIVKVMKAVCHTFDEPEKIAIITFDEVKVKEVHEYDQKHDCVMGPHLQMQVAMIRELFDKWRVPIYLDFDKQMASDLLNSLIRDAHDSGYVVKGCCSDMGGGNQGLLRVLGISPEITWIEHPVLSDEKIHFFGYAPHCLKLVRNWLLDTGFLLPDGSVVRKDPLEKLLNHVEVSSCFLTHLTTRSVVHLSLC
ncbi:Transposable element P transposase [Frankliniella fusca]|uniref:Transposable element P transposase n=1 Tax=Frankliniella fusca TaxID=407009 RepID=A0AAE1HBM9_9NEOP|nr:Transposable element P transposase [Frankliniella fusca]